MSAFHHTATARGANIKRRGLLLLTVLLCLLTTLNAQTYERDTIFNLNEVVVTATRTRKLLKDVPIQTRVITASDIQKADATNLQDLLQQEMPGIEFSYAMDQQVHLNFNGFGGQSLLILVDGARLAGETMDDVDFTRLDMTDVQRIEIVKGAASALYGSNAGGGVINIITKDGSNTWQTTPWTLNVNGRLARHNEQRYGASLGLNGKHLSNHLDFSYHTTDNYDVSNGLHPKSRVISTVYGDETYRVSDKVTFRPTDRLRIIGHAGYFFRTLTRITDTPERYRDFSGGLRGIWEMTADDDLEVSYDFDQYDKSNYQRLRDLDIRDYSNVQNTFRAIYNHRWGTAHCLTLGTDYQHDYLYKANLVGDQREQDVIDAFAQMDWNIDDRWEVVGALRYDYYSDGHDTHLTPKLTARYKARDNATLRFGYGMGFRAPTLKERYNQFDMAGIWIIEGNEQLKSEVSHHVNASWEWLQRNWCLTLSTYYNNVDNKISTGIPYYKPGNTKQPYLNYINLSDYSVWGGEATLQAQWSNGLSTRIAYALTKENLPRDNAGHLLNNQYIPAREHTVTARVEWDRQWSSHYGLNISLNGRFLSGVTNVEFNDYYDITKGTSEIDYPAYALLKLSTTHRIGKAVKVTLALDNLLDYRPDYYYLNSPITDGINLQAGVSIDIDRLF